MNKRGEKLILFYVSTIAVLVVKNVDDGGHKIHVFHYLSLSDYDDIKFWTEVLNH